MIFSGQKQQRGRDLARAVQMVWRGSAGLSLGVVVLCLFQAALPVANLFLLKRIIDTIAALAGKNSEDGQMARLWWLIAGALITQVMAVGAKSFGQVLQEAQAEKVTTYMQDLLHQKAIDVDLGYYENPEFKNTFHRAQMEAPYRPTQIVHSLAQLTQSLLTLAALSSFLFVIIDWRFALALVLATAPGLVLRLRESGRLFHWQQERAPIERRLEYYNWMLIGPPYAKENRLFGTGPVLKERAAALRHSLNRRRLRFTTRKAASEFVTQAAAAMVVFGTFGFLAHRALLGALSVGTVVMVYQGFQRLLGCFQEVLSAIAVLYENNLFVRHIHSFLDRKITLLDPKFPALLPCPMERGLRFENVRFRYPNSSRPCLEDVSLSIEPGEVVALVGDNGAGKSTLIKMLCRMYDPLDGRITIDGIDIRQFRKADLRRAVSVVFQDFVQYALSARDNIWFGCVDAPPTDDAIIGSARAAGADGFIRALDQGYDSILGSLFEGGHELSVGQWQKIALARAFLRPSQLIILDEPTSALDPKAEFELFEKFRQLAANRSTLLISHRLSTVRMADRIYVLREGRIIEQGRHEELVELGESYANLYSMQAASYR